MSVDQDRAGGQLGRFILHVVGTTVSLASTLPISFQPQPMYISSFGPLSGDMPYDEEGTGWGWRLAGKVDAKDTVLPTTCKMNRPS